MKPALFYSIVNGVHPRIVAVTSIHDSGRWAGRRVYDNSPTHGSGSKYGKSDRLGRFPTLEAAEAKKQEIADIVAKFDALRRPHSDAISRLYNAERAAIEAACKDV